MAIKCNDCGDIGDSTIERTFDWNNETIQSEPICNKCESKNVVRWDKTCPKCGEVMSNEVLLFFGINRKINYELLAV